MANVRNMTTEIKGGKLIITVDVNDNVIKQAPFSSTGKSRLVGSSGGYTWPTDKIGISLNVIAKN